MSWSNFIASGSGGIEFRLVVEGLDTEFVTSSALERTTVDGRVRRVGLKRESLSLHAGSGMITGKLEANGFTARIVDVNGAATAAFAADATKATFATADIDQYGSTLTALSTTGWPTNGVIHVGTECVSYVGTNATQFLNLARGFWDTIPQSHFSSLSTEQSRRTEITDRPVTIEGRRAYLYAYGEGDDPQGGGTRVFIGMVSRDANLSGPTEWSLTIDGMSRILAAELAGPGDGNVQPRGIYYPWASPLCVSLRQRTGTFWDDPVDAPNRVTTVAFCGFFETQAAFCAALEAALNAATSGWETKISIVSRGDAGWYPVVRTGATARYMTAEFLSIIDPMFSSFGSNGFRDAAGEVLSVRNVTANTSYIMRDWPTYETTFARPGGGSRDFVVAPGAVPRGVLSSAPVGLPATGSDADATNFPAERIYLQGGEGVATATAMFTNQIDNPGRSTYVSSALDTSLASVANAYVHASGLLGTYPYAGGMTLRFSRSLAANTTDGLAGLITWLITNSAGVCNLGGTPLVVSSDFDPAYATQIAAAHRGKQLATARRYFAPKKATLLDYLAEECKLIGVYPALNAAGQIKFVPLQLRAETETSAATVDASKQLTSAGFPGWERSAMGTVNSLVLKTGYNPMSEKHEGLVYNPRDVTAFSRSKMPRPVEIAPKSAENYALGYDPLPDVLALADSLFGVFGRPYRIATINVPWSLYSLVPGDVVTVTSAQLPSDDGTRGVTSQQGIVVSKTFRAGEAHGAIEVLLHGQNVAGYAPWARIASPSGSGTTITFSLTPAPISGDASYSAFPVGSAIRIMRYDVSNTASDRQGVVTVNTGSSITVVLTTSGALSGVNHLTWHLSTNIVATASQAKWAFVARSNGLIRHSGFVDVPARTFSP